MDPYATLGVEPEASDEDIKRAFRRLSLTYHPDRWLDDDEKRVAGSQWLRIASAYDTLSDTKKRMVRAPAAASHSAVVRLGRPRCCDR